MDSFPPRAKPTTDQAILLGRGVKISLGMALVCQIVLLTIAGGHNLHMFTSDAVAFVRIGQYAAQGKLELMISGYWGPLLSWLITPFLGMVESPQNAARVAMAISGIIFFLGTVALLLNLEIQPKGIACGAWIAALTSVYWSVVEIMPDMLLVGLMALTLSQLVSRRWLTTRLTPFLAGIAGGFCYLTKGVGFPLALAISAGIAGLWVFTRQIDPRGALRKLGITYLGFLVVASPWMLVLSLKYHRFVFSTAGPINHAIVGPPDKERFHPACRLFHKPEPGRLAAIEDFTYLHYENWSPFENRSYFKHQLHIIYHNALLQLSLLSNFDLLHFGLVAVLFGFLAHAPWRENLRRDRWRWVAVPTALIAGIYLPFYGEAERYYYPIYPLLIAATMGLVASLTPSIKGQVNFPRVVGLALISLSFLSAGFADFRQALSGLDFPSGIFAEEVAGKLKKAGIQGPMAGAGELYDWPLQYVESVSFYLHQPYYGHEATTTAERIKAAEVSLLFVRRQDPLIAVLDQDPDFHSLDLILFGPPAEADNAPVKVYQVR